MVSGLDALQKTLRTALSVIVLIGKQKERRKVKMDTLIIEPDSSFYATCPEEKEEFEDPSDLTEVDYDLFI